MAGWFSALRADVWPGCGLSEGIFEGRVVATRGPAEACAARNNNNKQKQQISPASVVTPRSQGANYQQHPLLNPHSN